MSITAFRSITYYADRFESEQNGAEEERKVLDLSNCHAILERQRLSENIIKYDRESSEHDNIRDCREWCQEFKIPDVINQDQGEQYNRHVYLQLP